jgi:hypothetical protein
VLNIRWTYVKHNTPRKLLLCHRPLGYFILRTKHRPINHKLCQLAPKGTICSRVCCFTLWPGNLTRRMGCFRYFCSPSLVSIVIPSLVPLIPNGSITALQRYFIGSQIECFLGYSFSPPVSPDHMIRHPTMPFCSITTST